MKSQMKTGVLLSYITLFTSNIVSILFTPIMLHSFGKSEYGLYNLSSSTISYLGIMTLGLNGAIIKYISRYRALNDKESEASLIGFFLIIFSVLALLVAIAGSFLIANIGHFFSAKINVDELALMRVLMIIMVISTTVSFPLGVFNGIISAYEQFAFQKTMALISTIVLPLVMLPLLFHGYKSLAMTMVSAAISILMMIANLIYCFFYLKIKIAFKRIDITLRNDLIYFASFTFLTMIIEQLYWNTDKFILGIVAGTSAVAIYAIGATFTKIFSSFAYAINSVIFPRISVVVACSASTEELSSLMIKYGRIQFIIMSYLFAAFTVFGMEFIRLWAGKDYSPAYYIALVVLIPLIIPIIQNTALCVINVQNRHRFRSIVFLVVAVLNVILSYYLAKRIGLLGCAISTGLAYFIGPVIIMNIYYHRVIRLNIPLFWLNIGRMSISIIIAIAGGFALNHFLVSSGPVIFMFKAIIFTLAFSLLMWFFSINSYEKNLFIRMFRRLRFN